MTSMNCHDQLNMLEAPNLKHNKYKIYLQLVQTKFEQNEETKLIYSVNFMYISINLRWIQS
jgi:hypothetical protein